MFRTVVLVLLVGCCMIDHWHINILISALHDAHNFEINLVGYPSSHPFVVCTCIHSVCFLSV